MAKQKLEDKYLKVIADSDGDTAEILMYGYIGQQDFWGENPEKDITDIAFAKTMRDLEKNHSRINVRINSPGGSMYHGNAIIAAIQNSKAEVHAYIDGMAASMAGDIWLACENRHMAKNALLMLHAPSGICMGTAKQMREEADILDKFEETVVAVMVDSTDMTEEDIRKEFYDYEDHWLTAKDCKEYGFISEADEYEAADLPADIEKMSYAEVVKHFTAKNDDEGKDLLTRLKEKFFAKTTKRVKSAPTVNHQSEEDMKIEDFNKSTGEKYTHADFVKCLEEAGYTVTPPAPEKTVQERIDEAVAAATKSVKEETATQIDTLTKKIEELGKTPAGGPTVIDKSAGAEERFAGMTPEQVKIAKELEAEAAKELA